MTQGEEIMNIPSSVQVWREAGSCSPMAAGGGGWGWVGEGARGDVVMSTSHAIPAMTGRTMSSTQSPAHT